MLGYFLSFFWQMVQFFKKIFGNAFVMKHEGQLKVFLLLATRLTILFYSLRDRGKYFRFVYISLCTIFGFHFVRDYPVVFWDCGITSFVCCQSLTYITMEAMKTIMLPAVGRDFQVGNLYNYHTDCVLESKFTILGLAGLFPV